MKKVNNRRRAPLAVAAVLALSPLVISAQEINGTIVLEPEESGPVFGYDGPIGPEFWAELDSAWATCRSGRQQSPINIKARRAVPARIRDIQFGYHPTAVNVLNNGHTVEVNYDSGSSISFGKVDYELLQFHFHSPSEHTFEGGAQFEAEMHLVHRSDDDRLAVVAVLINEGEENPAIPDVRRMNQALPKAEGLKYFLGVEFNVEDLLPVDRRPYVYRGSLTTPPCSEEVLWLVLRKPIEMSREQIATLNEALDNLAFASAAGTNNRPAQPLNGRIVRVDVK